MGVAKCVSLWTYGSRGDVEPLVGLTVRLPALAARFHTIAPAAEGCDGLVATGLMPAGAWL